jgi:peptidylprolyl isomerase
MEKTKKGDFVELKFTGFVDNKVFDSNIEEDLKKLDSEAKPEKTIVVIGEGMLVPGLDKALENKEIEKEYKIEVPFKEGFGPRRKELIRTIKLKEFTEKKINPYPGLMLALDNHIVKILAVSGARVTTDFNNPLSGKELNYKFKITRFVTDDKEKVETLLLFFLRFIPEFEIKENKIIVKGPKNFEIFVSALAEKFKELVKKELSFEEKKIEPKEHDHEHHEHSHDHDHSHSEHEHHEHSHEHKHEH